MWNKYAVYGHKACVTIPKSVKHNMQQFSKNNSLFGGCHIEFGSVFDFKKCTVITGQIYLGKS